jgi:hypothetical protein
VNFPYKKEAVLDLTPQVEGALIVALDDAVRNTEPQIADVPVVRSFLIDLSRESVLFRDQEWRARGLDPSNPDEVWRTTSRAFTEVLRLAEELVSPQNPAPFISVVQAIKDRWCDVFPLCR